MRFFKKWLKLNMKHSGKIIVQLSATIFISVVSITVALLMVKSSRLLYIDEILARYGNYDVAFCQVDDGTKNKIESDTRVDKIGYIYDLGEGYFTNGKGTVEVGCLSGADTEKMYYVNPVKGRYPQNENEICVDKVTLKENGYEGKLGETINVSIEGFQKTTYTLVGVIELQKQDSGEIYDTRYYPEKMYSLDNMKNINFPYAYIYRDKVKEYKALHLLVDAKEDAAAFIDSYLQDSTLSDLHITTELLCGRDWAILCLVGGETDGTSYSEIIDSTLENENQKYDGYTRYLVPIVLIIIFVLSFIGIIDALRRDSIDKYHYYSLFMRLGLRSKKIALYYFIEKILLLIIALLLGFLGGNGMYLLILYICNNKFDIYLPSVFDFDNFYSGYLNKMTINPYIAAAVVSTGCVLIAAMIMSFHLLKLKPIEMEKKSIRKVKRRKRNNTLSRLLNNYAWGEKNIYKFLPGIIMVLFMVTTVFGYQFFVSKSMDDTKEMKNQIEEARINGFDYYMYQNNKRYAGYTQYMHNTGITMQQYEELKKNKNVEKALPVMEEYSTAICLDKKDKKCNILAPQKYVTENTSNDVNSKIAYKAETES
jgi:ABC-type antimicrobial peptide transport system permease subunit